MIFQEPMSSLDPVLPVGAQIAETLTVHRGLGRGAARAEAVRLLDRVRIPHAADRARLYPHQLSGGMRQRVVIAAAIACKPALLIADEPTTALDATVQAAIVRLLAGLRNDVGCAVVLITHDMGLVRDVTDTVVVMSGGRVLEHGSREAVLTQPREALSLPPTTAPHRRGVARPCRASSRRCGLDYGEIVLSECHIPRAGAVAKRFTSLHTGDRHDIVAPTGKRGNLRVTSAMASGDLCDGVHDGEAFGKFLGA